MLYMICSIIAKDLYHSFTIYGVFLNWYLLQQKNHFEHKIQMIRQPAREGIKLSNAPIQFGGFSLKNDACVILYSSIFGRGARNPAEPIS